MKASKITVTLIAAIIVLSSFNLNVSAQSNLNPIVVMYEAGHAPQFAADDADRGMKLMLDRVNASTRYLVRVYDEPLLNESVLNDVDILIIPSPDRSNEYQESEFNAISKMLNNGSSMMVLGDPAISQNSTYWDSPPAFNDLGDNIALNRFLDGLNITGIRFSINETATNYWSDAMFDYDNCLNASKPWVIQLDASSWDTTHPIFRDINEITLMTGTLKPLNAANIIATGTESSFAQYRRGPFTFANFAFVNTTLFEERPLSYSAINGTFPPWMSAFQYNQSRIVVSGSTIMFSARSLDLPQSDGRSDLQWFYMSDNARLFMNMLDWLSEGFVESPSAISYMLIISSSLLMVGVAYYFLKKARR